MHSTKVLRAWEFVASTLRLEVGNIGLPGTERHDASRIAKPKARAEFDRRLDDLTHALNAGEVPVQQHYAYGPAAWTVLAGDAAEFGRRQGWGMPSKIKALKRPSERGTPITAPATQITTDAAQGSLAEQWADAKGDMKRKHALAKEAVKQCEGNKAAAARLLGLRKATGPLYRALNWKPEQSSGSSVAGMADRLSRGPHKT